MQRNVNFEALPRRSTRRSKNSQGPVAELKGTVDALIKENRTLKRQLAKMEQANREG
jgi:hypothetical protein